MVAIDYNDAHDGFYMTTASSHHAQQQDLEYDSNFVSNSVKSFVVHIYRHIREKNVYEIYQMYKISFHTLSDCLLRTLPGLRRRRRSTCHHPPQLRRFHLHLLTLAAFFLRASLFGGGESPRGDLEEGSGID
ncbi:hypothetical protein PIB30_058069 [Stylosanthes scabra]|uniref:Uncharacterized protein n=1 Tax=Stylosanthes scabra TaxID=79078 RepID=A0ABU6QK71_9FABA|nr:hypothetical protein [Stylosanthes scabra]